MKLIQSENLDSLSFVPSLVKAYLNNDNALKEIGISDFNLNSLDSFIEKKKTQSIDREKLKTILLNQYLTIDSEEEVNKNIILLKSENTFCVTSAHQPSLLLGPAYVIIKISATISACLKFKKQYPNYNFVPVFWMGSEDHDKEELCHTYFNQEKIEWNTEAEGPIGKFDLKGMENALKSASTLMKDNPTFFNYLSDSISSFKDFGALTFYMLHQIFKDFGLVIIDQNQKEIKQLFSSVIKDEIKYKRAMEVLKPSNDWLKANFHAQVNPRNINFFYLQKNSRKRITEKDGKFEIGEQLVNVNQLDNFIDENIESFSPNVIFRPLLQELILPNICFVGGSAEISYWLQLKPLFDYYYIPYPFIAHRPLVVFARDSSYQKVSKLHLSPLDFLDNEDTIIRKWISGNASVDFSFEQEMLSLNSLFEDIIIKVNKTDKSLEGTVNAEKQKAINGIENIKSRLIKAEKRNNETAITQIAQIKNQFSPSQILIERIENSISFYSQLSKDEFHQFVISQDPTEKKLHFYSF